jgi:hypothetical protein
LKTTAIALIETVSFSFFSLKKEKIKCSAGKASKNSNKNINIYFKYTIFANRL